MHKIIKIVCAAVMTATLFTCAVSCDSLMLNAIAATDLNENVKPSAVQGAEIDGVYKKAAADFAADLLKQAFDGTNTVISPLSVMLALSMTANGAGGQTLAEMEETLGGISIDEMNKYLYAYVKGLSSDKDAKFQAANSIWFRDDQNRLNVVPSFLQKNADYYGAAAYSSPFDNTTLNDINAWVSEKTDGMINSILDSIDADAVLYLINAIVFDAKWQKEYSLENVSDGEFTSEDGARLKTDFMFSEEGIYLEGSGSTGFIKPYMGGKYSFAALLPDDGIPAGDFIAGMTGDAFLNILAARQNTTVAAWLPKFKYDYDISLNAALKELGIREAFDSQSADFKNMAVSSRGNIYIFDVIHKAYIAVDELGTKAGAVTKVEMHDESFVEMKEVRLNRPFVYAIIDNETDLPVFMGAYTGAE